MSYVRHRTIKSYMAGIRHLHIEEGLEDPFLPALPRLHYVLRGVKRSQGEEGGGSRERLPITPLLLHRIKAAWGCQASDLDIVMLWAACCVPGDTGYDHSIHLSWGDLAVDDPVSLGLLSVHLKASKTDPFRKGSPCLLAKCRRSCAQYLPCWRICWCVASDPGPYLDSRILNP